MARKFVSPGVFTSEKDQSFLAQGVASIGAAVIGLTKKGPAFTPTLVTDFDEFTARFGDTDPSLQMPYAVRNYLKNSSTCQVVRVLGSRDINTSATNGWNHSVVAVLASGGEMLAEIHVLSGTAASLVSGSTITFSFSGTSGSFAGKTYSGSFGFDSTAQNYIERMLNTDPTKASQYGHYLYKLFKWAGSGSGAPFASASLSGATTKSFDYDFTEAVSPWIIDQYQDQVFRLHTVSDGEGANHDVKVTITNIKASPYPSVTPYGTFDVVIRSFADTDLRPQALETFTGVTLDPKSSKYLPRVIGDQYVLWNSTTRKNIVNGTYKNRSKYVYVEMSTVDLNTDALPWGHSGYAENGTSAGAGSVKDVPYVADNLDNQGNVAPTYWGVDFSQDGIADRLKAGLDPAHAVSFKGASLDLRHVSGVVSGGVSYKVYNTGSSGTLPSTTAFDGFTVAFAGGFDGWDLTNATPVPTGSINAADVARIALKLGVDTLSNPDEIDLNLLAIPGVTEAAVAAYASLMCNNRADCLYIMDVDASSVSACISDVDGRGVDDNYSTTYYPDLRYSDADNGVQARVKPSVAMLGAYAYNDRVGQVFFAPAGLNRGGLEAFGIVDVCDRLNFQDRNDLYEARINPIATFPNEGIVAFGQKTLQAKPSALDRVNVRRLLIFAKKTIASAAKYLLFEPGNPATWQRFLNMANPILEKVRQDQGLERFKVVMDSTTNTPDLIDRNQMTGKIFLQPTRAAEFIDLSFIITASGVSFEE